MERASWRSKLILVVLGIAIPLLWWVTLKKVRYYLDLQQFSFGNALFGEHLAGLALLLITILLYNKLSRKIEIGTLFSNRSVLPIALVFIIYSASAIYQLLSGTHQEVWVKLVVQTPWPYIVPVYLTILVLAPIGEEMVFRGYMANAFPLEQKWGVILSSLVTATLFSYIHFQYKNLVTSLEIVALGFVFIWARIRSGGLGLPIFLHFLAGALGTISGLLLP